jgi:hypothetical protein
MGVIDAVEDVDGKIAITAYPNPTSDIIYVEVSQDHVGSEFTLRDISGREIARFLATTERVSLDLSQVEAGVYILSTQELSSSLQIIVR